MPSLGRPHGAPGRTGLEISLGQPPVMGSGSGEGRLGDAPSLVPRLVEVTANPFRFLCCRPPHPVGGFFMSLDTECVNIRRRAFAHNAPLPFRARLGLEPSEGSRVWRLRELTMKQLAFAIGLLAVAFTASTPARADYALIQFGDGYCRIWWDSADTPWGIGWTKIVVGLPDHIAAEAALDAAIMQRVCQ